MLFSKRLRSSTHLLAYHLYAKRKISKTDIVSFDGLRLEVPPGVFHPRLYFSSKFLASHVSKLALRDKKVLDMGCGSGILSLCAARKGATVVAVDINPVAIVATMKNAEMNGLKQHIVTVKSDLFQSLSPLHRDFDVVLSNPPYYLGKPKNTSDAAWRGGDNFLFLNILAEEVSSFLSPSGKVIIVLSSDIDIEKALSIFNAKNILMSEVCRRRFYFETLHIFEGTIP